MKTSKTTRNYELNDTTNQNIALSVSFESFWQQRTMFEKFEMTFDVELDFTE